MTEQERTRRGERELRERTFRDEITTAFRERRIGVENGWLVEYHDPCTRPCTEYGCPPSCSMTPIADLWRIHG